MKRETANQRHAKILEQLSCDGEVFVQALSDRFGVTTMTIRRDLEALERGNALVRTHGGAVFSKRSVAEFAFVERNRKNINQKRAIACEVAGLVEAGMAIILDTGTTSLEVARAIAGIEGLRVLTSSLAIASELHAHENIELVLLGGNVRKNSPDLTGSLTEENLRQFRVQLAILGADAVDQRGFYASDLSVARVSKAMIECADETVLVVDSGKFVECSFVKIADWKDLRYVVTDQGVSRKDRRWLNDAARDVRFAKKAEALASHAEHQVVSLGNHPC